MGHGLRISNSGVASLRNNIVQGLNAGRTEIKVCINEFTEKIR